MRAAEHDAFAPLPPVKSLQLLRSESLTIASPILGMNLIRTAQMIPGFFSTFLCEVELYSLLRVERGLAVIVQKDIASLQAKELKQHAAICAQIAADLQRIQRARSVHSAAELQALDAAADTVFQSRVLWKKSEPDEPRITADVVERLRALVLEQGAQVSGRDYEGFARLSDLIRLHILNQTGVGSCYPARVGDEEQIMREMALSREFIQLVLLSHPALGAVISVRSRGSVDYWSPEDFDAIFMTVLYLSSQSVSKSSVHVPSLLLLGSLAQWIVALYAVMPLIESESNEWLSREERLLHQVTNLVGQPDEQLCRSGKECASSKENPPLLRQLRWNILRACSGSGAGYDRILTLHPPLIAPKLHKHTMMRCDDQWYESTLCSVCNLAVQSPALVCTLCQVRVHAACGLASLGSSSSSPSSASAASSSPATASSAITSPSHPPAPPEWVYDWLSYSARDFLRALATCSLELYGVLTHSSSPALWMRMRFALLQTAKKGVHIGGYAWRAKKREPRFMIVQWIDASLSGPAARKRFLALLTHPQFCLHVVQTNSSSAAPSYLLAQIFFDLLRRKERSVLEAWMAAQRPSFLQVWPFLFDAVSGLGPLHFLCAEVRGCRERLFTLLLHFTVEALSLPPAAAVRIVDSEGRTVEEMLQWRRNSKLGD